MVLRTQLKITTKCYDLPCKLVRHYSKNLSKHLFCLFSMGKSTDFSFWVNGPILQKVLARETLLRVSFSSGNNKVWVFWKMQYKHLNLKGKNERKTEKKNQNHMWYVITTLLSFLNKNHPFFICYTVIIWIHMINRRRTLVFQNSV